MAVAVNGRQSGGTCSSTRGISSMRSVGCTRLGTLRASVSVIGFAPTQMPAFLALKNTVRSFARTWFTDAGAAPALLELVQVVFDTRNRQVTHEHASERRTSSARQSGRGWDWSRWRPTAH